MSTTETTTETTETTAPVTEPTEPSEPTKETPDANASPDPDGSGGSNEPGERNLSPDEPKVFDESYVRSLRKESAGYREKAKRVDEMGARLHTALVTATGRLQDATDIPFDPAHLDDAEALTAAIDALLTTKPHLASRKPQGYINQGATPVDGGGMSLGGMLRAQAG